MRKIFLMIVSVFTLVGCNTSNHVNHERFAIIYDTYNKLHITSLNGKEETVYNIKNKDLYRQGFTSRLTLDDNGYFIYAGTDEFLSYDVFDNSDLNRTAYKDLKNIDDYFILDVFPSMEFEEINYSLSEGSICSTVKCSKVSENERVTIIKNENYDQLYLITSLNIRYEDRKKIVLRDLIKESEINLELPEVIDEVIEGYLINNKLFIITMNNHDPDNFSYNLVIIDTDTKESTSTPLNIQNLRSYKNNEFIYYYNSELFIAEDHRLLKYNFEEHRLMSDQTFNKDIDYEKTYISNYSNGHYIFYYDGKVEIIGLNDQNHTYSMYELNDNMRSEMEDVDSSIKFIVE